MYNSYKPHIKKPSKGRVIDITLADIPWAEWADVYDSAANEAAELSTTAFRNTLDREYAYSIKRKEEAWELQNPEAGSYEGNFSDSFPQAAYPPTPNLAKIRRQAGQTAFIDKLIKHYSLGSFTNKLLPELVQLIGSWHVTRNCDGLVSGLQFCKDHFSTPERMGMHRLLTLNSKSDFLEKQYKGDGRTYCALVPIIMYAQRKAKNIKYSEWDPEEIQYVMHSKLCDAMLWRGDVPDNETLLKDRDTALVFQSGARAGSLRDPISTYRLYGTAGTCYEGIPEYAQTMLSQIWCAHPSNRTKYMVLDPINWDNVPMPLVTVDPFTDPTFGTSRLQKETTLDMPWL